MTTVVVCEEREDEHLSVLVARAAALTASIASRIDELAGVPGDVVDEVALTLERCRGSLDAAQGTVLASMDVAGACRSRHALTAAGWVAHETRQRAGALVELSLLGGEVRDLEYVSAFWRWGDLSRAHVRMLAWAAKGRRGHFVDDELLLCKWALTLPWRDFAQRVRAWVESVDPHGADRDAARIERERRVRIGWGLHGTGILEGELTPVARAQIAGELDRLTLLEEEADWAEARARLGPDVCKADLRRTDAQRRHDALRAMAERSAACDDELLGRAASSPAVVVHIDAATFEAHMTWAADEATDVRMPSDGMCELADGTRLTRRQFLDVAFLASIRTLVYDAQARPIATGRPGSLYRGRLRQTVVDLRRDCDVDGCGWPGVHCDVDHVEPRERGGDTSLANASLLCPLHHRMRHHGHLRPVRGPDGEVRWISTHRDVP